MAAVRILDLDLPPDVFAIVMATGIVSVAASDHQYWRIGIVLAAIASVVFVVLTIGLGLRILTRSGVIVAQSTDPDVALRMFTFVAGASVLGVVWRRYPVAVWIVGALSLIGWLVLIPLGARDVHSRPRTDLRDHAHGAWLLVSVGTSGLATTAADLAIIHGSRPLVMIGVACWLLAMVLYVAVTWLIAWRVVVAPFRPDAVTPDSWILMGALAIATLAGTHLLQATDELGSLQWLADAVGPVTLVLWIVGSLWIPVLLYAEIWRVDQRAGSLRFAGVWWSAVFPLGMYSSATWMTGIELDMPALATISLVFFWIAATVWALVTVGLTQFAVMSWRRGRAAGTPSRVATAGDDMEG
jgi:tellurite resistance protein TehA-like permease